MERKQTKVKIFLYLAFAILAIMVGTQIYRLISQGTRAIHQGNEQLKCVELSYDIESTYNNNVLVLEITSKSYDLNITKITVTPDTSDTEYTNELDEVLKGGNIAFLRIENISITNRFFIYAENCKKNGKYIRITK